jgi:hypothetical protein
MHEQNAYTEAGLINNDDERKDVSDTINVILNTESNICFNLTVMVTWKLD